MLEHKRRLADYLEGFLSEKRRALFDRVLAERTRYLRLLVADPNDPGDAFAVMRSCECFGIQNYHVVSSSGNLKISKGIAVGSSKWVTLKQHQGESAARDCMTDLKRLGYRVAAVNTRGRGIPVRQMPLDSKLVLCLSGDGGFGPAVRESVDLDVHVPVRGFGSGFNLSVCAALCLADVRFALERSDLDWKLSEAERLDLRLEWLAAAPKKIGLILDRYVEEHGPLDGALFTANFRRLTGL